MKSWWFLTPNLRTAESIRNLIKNPPKWTENQIWQPKLDDFRLCRLYRYDWANKRFYILAKKYWQRPDCTCNILVKEDVYEKVEACRNYSKLFKCVFIIRRLLRLLRLFYQRVSQCVSIPLLSMGRGIYGMGMAECRCIFN